MKVRSREYTILTEDLPHSDQVPCVRHLADRCGRSRSSPASRKGALQLGETAVRAFGVVLDLQHADGQAAEPLRVMPHLRYLNAFEEPTRRALAVQERARAAGRHRHPRQEVVAISSRRSRRRATVVLLRDCYQAQLVLPATILRPRRHAFPGIPLQRARSGRGRHRAGAAAGDAQSVVDAERRALSLVESDADTRTCCGHSATCGSRSPAPCSPPPPPSRLATLNLARVRRLRARTQGCVNDITSPRCSELEASSGNLRANDSINVTLFSSDKPPTSEADTCIPVISLNSASSNA